MLVRTLFTLSASAAALLADDNAFRRCSNASLRGVYGFTAQGFTVAGSPVPAPLQGPFASLGTATYDGRGNVTLAASATFNGITQTLPPVKGAYHVNSDCTSTSRLENGATFYASIVDSGRELFVIQTNPGVVASGVASLQSGRLDDDSDDNGNGNRERMQSCRVALTRGVYGFISQGTGAPPTVPAPAAGPLTGVGTVNFAPNGSFKLTAVRSSNGIVDPQPLNLTGNYQFTSDCNFQMKFDVVGFQFNGTVTNGGREAFFLETDPGTTFLVKAKRMQ